MFKHGLKVLRYGSQSRIREDLKEMTLEWYLDQHPQKNLLDRVKAETYKTPKGKLHVRPVYVESDTQII